MSTLYEDNDRQAQRLAEIITDPHDKRPLSWTVPGLLLVALRIKLLLSILYRLFYLLVVRRQWLRLTLTIGWLAGIVESFRILDAATSGPFWQTLLFMAVSFSWIAGGMWMNRDAIRESNGLPPQAAGKGDDHA